MPMASANLVPGVNTQKSLSQNQAGVSQSQAVRYKDGIVQALGGWTPYVSFTANSTVRAALAWQGISNDKHLALGGTASLNVITAGSMSNVMPQTTTFDFTPAFSVSSGSNVVTVVIPNSSLSTYDALYFNTPVSVGGILVSSGYQITNVLGSSAVQIHAANNSSVTVVSSGILSIFQTVSGSGLVTVTLPNNGAVAATGLFYPFIAATSVGGLTIQGPYSVNSVGDSTNFVIGTNLQSTTTTSTTQNGGLAQAVAYITMGPQPGAFGYGSGGYGLGGYGTGSGVTGAPGTSITATDWSLANWGEALIAVPKNGPVYMWAPSNGFTNASVVPTAPLFNGGMFISTPQQILVLWGSVQSSGVQDQLIVRWSNALDYTNFTVSNETTAGSFKIPTGSLIMGGLQGPQQAMIWTDVDAWVISYAGGNEIFNFTRVGSGCGLIGAHAAGVLAGDIYWCSQSNFYVLSSGGLQVIPCTVWDFIFQNLNTTYQSKVFCAPNSAFNEIEWFFPATGSTECNAYVKYNIVEKEWDYGYITRTAWTDVSVLGNPIGTDTSAAIYQHESGNITYGAGNPSFQTGWWAIADGNEYSFVDFVIPDFIWGNYGGAKDAEMQVILYSANYPGDTPIAYGPYTVTQQNQYITPRLRGRLMSMFVQGVNDEFFRLGRVRYRYATSGRR